MRSVNINAAQIVRSFAVLVLALLCVAPGSAQVARFDSVNELPAADVRRTSPPPAAPRVLEPPKAPSLSLSPAVVMTKGHFGQSVSQMLTLSNSTPYELSFDMVAEDVTVENGKRVYMAAGETPGSIAASAVFSARSVTVKPFSTETVEARFTIPQGTPLRAVVAVFRGSNRIQTSRSGIAMTASLGTLITFNMSETIKLAAEPLQATGQADASSLVFSQWLTNAGDEPIVPDGLVAVLDQSGALVGKAPFTAQRLLPGERLEFKAECMSPLTPGKYRALASYKVEGRTITKSSEFTVR